MHYTFEELAGMIDHAALLPVMTDAELEANCLQALRYGVASVCIKPYAVPFAARLLAGSSVKVCTVIGFPHGSTATEVKRYEAEEACRAGATEIDMVINIGKALSEDWDYVESDIRAVVDEGHRQGALVKVIFETDYITDDAMKIRLCKICTAAGADFVKTSTGFGYVKGTDGKYSSQGATEHDLKLMREHCPPIVGVKASGGVRNLDALIRCRDLGCARVGTSSTAAILEEYKWHGAISDRESSEQEDANTADLGAGGY